jgi:hypothetical protein
MNLKKLNKEVGSTFYKDGDQLLKKNSVRELEENGKNSFIAFVDDGPDSFDVAIIINEKFDIIESSCDCSETYFFCKHKVAVALHLKTRDTNNSSSVVKRIKAKKIDPLQSFVDDIPIEQLRNWIFELAKKDKEFNLQLKNKFEKKFVSLDFAEIESKTEETVKAVLGKAKYFDNTQLAKIIDLWTPYHMEVFNEIFLQKNNFNGDLIAKIIKHIGSYRLRAKTKPTRLIKYIDNLNEHIKNSFDGLELQVKNKMSLSLIEIYLKNIHENEWMFKTIVSALVSEKKEVRDSKLPSLIRKLNDHEHSRLLKELINTLLQNKLFRDFSSLFSTFYGMQDYNTFLIKTLVNEKLYMDAERICDMLIRANTSEYYSYPYRKILCEIYKETNDDVARVEQLKITVNSDLTYGDYEEIVRFLKDKPTELKQFENNFNKALKKLAGEVSYGKFIFTKAVADKDYETMIANISSNYPIRLFYDHVQNMYEYDANLLLENLVILRDREHKFRSLTKEDTELYYSIFDKFYSIDEVKQMAEHLKYKTSYEARKYISINESGK